MNVTTSLPLDLVLLAWAAFALYFIGILVLRRPGPRPAQVRRAPASTAGLWLQAIGYTLVWAFRREMGLSRSVAEEALCWFGVALAWLSAGTAVQAIRTLGRQWSVEARLVEGHRLVVDGPYRFVRHPIYAALLGLLVATGVNLSPWPALGAGVLVYLGGTLIRVRAEEALLREGFGQEYESYARRVRAIVPWPLRGRADSRS